MSGPDPSPEAIDAGANQLKSQMGPHRVVSDVLARKMARMILIAAYPYIAERRALDEITALGERFNPIDVGTGEDLVTFTEIRQIIAKHRNV